MPQLDVLFYFNAVFSGLAYFNFIFFINSLYFIILIIVSLFFTNNNRNYKILSKYSMFCYNWASFLLLFFYKWKRKKAVYRVRKIVNKSAEKAAKSKSHYFQIVSPSVLPFFLAFCLLIILSNVPEFLHSIKDTNLTISSFNLYSYYIIILVFLFLIYVWFLHLRIEAQNNMIYNKHVMENIKSGFSLFIISEIMLFFAFFWAFFHSSTVPSIFIGNVWPPVNIQTLSWAQLPFLNTILLVSSGVSCNFFYYTLNSFSYNRWFKGFIINKWAFELSSDLFFTLFLNYSKLLKLSKIYFMMYYFNVRDVFAFYKVFFVFYSLNFIGNFNVKGLLNVTSFYTNFYVYIQSKMFNILVGLYLTIVLGLLFLGFQYVEYVYHVTYGLNNIYGTMFFMTTGLHGLHVFVGVCMLLTVFIRFFFNEFNRYAHPSVGVICTVWYWHFVDIVWILLYGFLYIWGS